MRIQRPPQRRGYGPPLMAGCFMVAFGCLACVTISVLLFLPAVPDLALRVAGFQSSGSTEQLFQQNTAAPAPIQNPAPPPTQAILEFGIYGQANLSSAPFAYDLAIDAVTGEAHLTIPESSLMTLCQQQTQLCGTGTQQVRNASIDLRPGAAVVNGDFFIPQFSLWQELGIVVQPQNLQLNVAGVDINGSLYQSYDDHITSLVSNFESQAGQLLNQLALNTGDSRYNLTGIYIDDSALTLILR